MDCSDEDSTEWDEQAILLQAMAAPDRHVIGTTPDDKRWVFGQTSTDGVWMLLGEVPEDVVPDARFTWVSVDRVPLDRLFAFYTREPGGMEFASNGGPDARA